MSMRSVTGTLLVRFSNGIALPHSNCYLTPRHAQVFSVQSSRLLVGTLLLAHGYHHFLGLNMEIPVERFQLPLSCVWAGALAKLQAERLLKMLRSQSCVDDLGRKLCLRKVEKGGSSPGSNTYLAALFEKAKELDIPREIIDRNIKRASEKGQEAYIEKFYEVYGYGGAGMVVQVLTDKVNRSVAAVREVVKDCGGKMADSGSMMFKFKRARVVNIKATEADKDQLLTVALDAGADDVIEPSLDEDDSDEDSERCYKIVSSLENYSAILTKLRAEGIKFETDNGYELLPLTPIEVDDEARDLNKELISQLLELDDVDAVYTDQK